VLLYPFSIPRHDIDERKAYQDFIFDSALGVDEGMYEEIYDKMTTIAKEF
jgi:hypothetical protein